MTAARYLCLTIPVGLVLVGTALDRDSRARGAALLAFVASAVGLAGLSEAAGRAGWYRFAPVDGAFRGVPVDLWLGWAALWGPVPVLFRRLLSLPVALGLLLWLDLVAMPALHPLVGLGPHWLRGELVGLLAVALPAQVLGRWTAERRHLRTRAGLQVVVFTAVLLWLVPTAAFEFGDGSWARMARLPLPVLLTVVQVGGLLAVPGLLAVREFVMRGGGTPYPWDPPGRLVVTGPYAYLSNPMQVSAVALLALLAAVAGSGSLALAVVSAVAFSAAVAGPHEKDQLMHRYGAPWRAYRAGVPAWLPRRVPYRGGVAAVLWLDEECDTCSGVAAFLHRRAPRQLTLAPAREHRPTLERARYAGGDGYDERGVAAVARALEHVNLYWAYLGWILRLPGIGWLAQLVTDAVIAPPHPATRAAPRGETRAAPRGEKCPATPGSGCSTERYGPSRSTASSASPHALSPRRRA